MTRPCACGVTDVHTHYVPHDFPRYAGRHAGARWPSMQPDSDCHRNVIYEGKVYRKVSHHCWTPAARLEDMAAQGVDRQVVSPMPELLSYWLAPEDGAVLCRYLNESLAELAASNPGRLTALGAVPLQDVDLAIAELEHAVNVFGLAGVEIGSNINDTVIGDARFEPFFTAAARLGAAIFVHPLRPAGMNRLVGPKGLEQVLAFPGEIGLAAASMLTGGTLARNPALRIAFSHGGGSLAMLLPRLQQGWSAFAPIREACGEAPVETVRRMYFDNLVYDAQTAHTLLRVFGDERVMVGSDYPFAIREREPAARLASLNLESESLERVGHLNAERWLGERGGAQA
jgi:aminocarboxymuconate-semialdehyde decarboxylase